MRDQWEDTLFRMAEKEQIIMPDELTDRIDGILCKLKEERIGFRMNWKKSLILAAALTMLLSATAVASVGALRERMESMNREKLEAYLEQIYTTKIGHDNYNRPYTDTEKERMETLRAAYQSEARFPKREITMIDEARDYKGKSVAFLGDTTTFFFPEQEMSDEELLQIIDFLYKRDYSLAKMNEMIAAREAQMPDPEVGEIEATDTQILESNAVYEPGQELTIPYTGDLELDMTIAAGDDEIYLAGFNTVHRMEIGSSDSRVFFDDFGVETRILAMCQDAERNVYMALWQWLDESDAETRTLAVWVVSEKGELLRKIDLSPYITQGKTSITSRMVIDGKGYLYIKMTGLESLDESAECGILVLDREGEYVAEISSGEYYMDRLGGLCVGKDGRVYTEIGNYYDPDDTVQRLGIASVNVEVGKLGDVCYDIIPDDCIMIDIVAPGAESDFVFWGYDGIYTYDLGDEHAEHILHAYEAPCDWEGARCCALPDGRILLAKCTEYRREQTELGMRLYGVPEKTYFYYLPGVPTE